MKYAGRQLFPDKPLSTHLYARVSVLNPAFSITLQYRKIFTDGLSGFENYATTRKRGVTGTAKDAGFIMNSLAELMDKFLVEFLRVNESDC